MNKRREWSMKKICLVLILALAFGEGLIPGSVHAAESGAGHYVPGALADFADLPPPSGFAVLEWYNHYDGSFSGEKQLPFGGRLAADLNATSNAEMLGAIYTFPFTILGGKYSIGTIIPYVWMSVTGKISVTGPQGTPFTVTRTDTVNGIGDIIFMPFWLSWACGDFKWSTQLDIYAPTGEYNVGQLANAGFSYGPSSRWCRSAT